MNYYLLSLHTFEGYDSKTEFINKKATNYGIQFSSFPIDNIMTFDSKYFCSERLFFSIFDKNAPSDFIIQNVLFVNEIRVEKNPNWLANCKSARIPRFFEIEFHGQAFKDDIGVIELNVDHPVIGPYKSKVLIASEKAIKLLILNHSPNISGVKVTKEDMYKMKNIETKIYSNMRKYILLNQITGY